jgi:DNA-binding transcriptional LysR family regulator
MEITHPGTALHFGFHGSPRAARAIARTGATGDERIELSEYDLTDPFATLRSGDLDVMIVKFEVDEDDLALSTVLATDGRVAIVGAHHPLATRDSVSVEELAAFDGFERPGAFPPYVWDQVVPRCTPAGRTIRRRHRLVDAETMMRTVAATDAFHLSLASLADVALPSIRVVAVHDLAAAPVRLAWLRGRVSPRVRAFVDRAEAAAAAR